MRKRSFIYGSWRLLCRVVHSLRVGFAHVFSDVPQRILTRSETRHQRAGVVIDLFATVLRQLEHSATQGIDTAIDILRYNFPNVEHQWLIRRFNSAYQALYPLKGRLTLASRRRTKEERLALSLELFFLLHQIDANTVHSELFAKICTGLGVSRKPEHFKSLLSDEEMEFGQNMETILFSPQLGRGDFLLDKQEEGVIFRAVRCAHLLLIINYSPKALYLRGRELAQGGILPLHPGQEIELRSRAISHEHILFLLQAKYAEVRVVNYLEIEDDSLTMSRHRTRHSMARVRLGLFMEIELLRRDVEIEIDGRALSHRAPASTSYYTPCTIDGKGPYVLADLSRYGSQDRRFYLNPTFQKVIVSNIANTNQGTLILTPGLASACVFEVSYSRSTNTGHLRILEGCTGLRVEGQLLRGNEIELHDGDIISLSDIQSLRCRFGIGVLDEESNSITKLEVQGLSKDFSRSRRVLDNIGFSLKRGEMACVLGPSGSGKSTLLAMLAGHMDASYGSIHYNGRRFSNTSNELRRHIAYIPREDILDEAMSVEEHIVQASIIRRPRLTRSDRMRRVQAVLNFIGLGHIADRRVGHERQRTISDGERTRLNLGLDLTGTAEIYLIDEPISGLSSGDSERVINTLEDMSESRIVLCSLHRPAASLLRRFQKVLVLDRNGQMAFWGSPREMLDYFEQAAREMQLIITPESISAGGADYVFEVLEASNQRYQHHRNKNTRLWQQRYESHVYRINASEVPKEKTKPTKVIPFRKRRPLDLWRHFKIWVARTFLGRIRSRMGLYALLLEGPVLGLLIGGTLRAASEEEYSFYKALHISEYLFLSLVLAMFFGLMVAACEVLRDRPILKRESNYKPFTTGYLLSKIFVLTGLASTQCALYLLVSNWILDINLMFLQHWGILTLTAFVGIAISLMISAFVRSERVALNLVPLVLVPQILLAGALVRFEEMNDFIPEIPDGIIPANIEHHLGQLRHRVAYQDTETHDIKSKALPLIAEFCPMRYAFELIFVAQTENNRWEDELETINKKREYLKQHGTVDELRFIQRAVLALNSLTDDNNEARRILRRVRNAALDDNVAYFDSLEKQQEEMKDNPKAQPLEFFYTNRELTSLREGVKSARKDVRQRETRGYFLSARQPRAFQEMEQITDADSISTIKRNIFYLLFMGLFPLIITGWKVRRIARKSS